MIDWWIALVLVAIGAVAGQFVVGFIGKAGSDAWDRLKAMIWPPPPAPAQAIISGTADLTQLRSHPDIGEVLPSDRSDDEASLIRSAQAHGCVLFHRRDGRPVHTEQSDLSGDHVPVLLWTEGKGPTRGSQ